MTETPTEYKPFSVEGKSIKFWSTPDANRTAFFQTESKGYRNTYKIDCVGKALPLDRERQVVDRRDDREFRRG